MYEKHILFSYLIPQNLFEITKGAGDLIRVKGVMKNEQNNSTLQRHYIPSGFRTTFKNVYIMAMLSRFKKGTTFENLTWPDQYPDCSLIELVKENLDMRDWREYLKSEN